MKTRIVIHATNTPSDMKVKIDAILELAKLENHNNMKKYFFFMTLVSLLFISCASDSNSNSDPDAERKIKKMVSETAEDLPDNWVNGVRYYDEFVEDKTVVRVMECDNGQGRDIMEVAADEPFVAGIKHGLANPDNDNTELFQLMVDAGYSLVYRFVCHETNESKDVVFDTDDLNEIIEDTKSGRYKPEEYVVEDDAEEVVLED